MPRKVNRPTPPSSEGEEENSFGEDMESSGSEWEGEEGGSGSTDEEGREQGRVSKERDLIKRKLTFPERGRGMARGNRSNKRRRVYTYPSKPRAIVKPSIRITDSESEGEGDSDNEGSSSPSIIPD